MNNYDYIIVGLAQRAVFSQIAYRKIHPKSSAARGEQKDNYFWIDIPVGYLFTIGNPRTDWCFETELKPASTAAASATLVARSLVAVLPLTMIHATKSQTTTIGKVWATAAGAG